MQVANPNRAQFTKCAGYAIPYTTPDFALFQFVFLKPYKALKMFGGHIARETRAGAP